MCDDSLAIRSYDILYIYTKEGAKDYKEALKLELEELKKKIDKNYWGSEDKNEIEMLYFQVRARAFGFDKQLRKIVKQFRKVGKL